MKPEKRPVCCARKHAKLTMDEANLARLARMASAAASRGQSTVLWQARIAEEQMRIAQDKLAIIDHEADHAAGPVAP